MIMMINPMENRPGKGKLFMCFKPAAAAASDDGPVEVNGKLVGSSETRKKKFRRSLAGAVKAAFFEKSLGKKFGGKNSRQNSIGSRSNFSSTKSEKVAKHVKKNASYKELSDPAEEIFRINSSRSSLFSPTSSTVTASSSSCDNSISCNSRSVSERKSSVSFDFQQSKKNKKSMKRDVENCYNPIIGMCIIVVSLMALVFCGKVFAILTCTTTWLFFIPRRLRHVDSPVNDVDSEEYKKRVIMEGLLERNRSRVSQS